MPIYEYECPEEHRFEEEHLMDESGDPQECPECGQEAGRIITSAPTIHFKGDGWTPKHHEGGSVTDLAPGAGPSDIEDFKNSAGN